MIRIVVNMLMAATSSMSVNPWRLDFVFERWTCTLADRTNDERMRRVADRTLSDGEWACISGPRLSDRPRPKPGLADSVCPHDFASEWTRQSDARASGRRSI